MADYGDKATNFSEWFHNILEVAQITDARYPIKGMAVWLPYGFQIRKTELAKEGIHVKGFEDEVYWVTHGGPTELNEKLALRPTSETSMYPMFSLWIRSHIDLPIKQYQVVNTFRYETKHTRPLIRVREITTFAEAHTVHSSAEECAEQVETGIEIYKTLFDEMGIPYLISKRPVWDKFPGAEYTMAFDTIMPDGKTLQIGTVHNLGQTFAETFDITFENKEGEHEYAYQTCYGISDRVIAAAIAAHGDEKGLVLPPTISPSQVTIIPIIFKKGAEEVMAKCEEIKEALESNGIRVDMDTRDIRPGKKFFDWELKGTPIRFELGPRDLENNKAVIGRRDTEEKMEIDLDEDIPAKIIELLGEIDSNLKENAWKSQESHLIEVDSLDDVASLVDDGKVISFHWCGDEECGKAIEEETDVDVLGITEEDIETDKVCPHCGKPAKHIALMAKTY